MINELDAPTIAPAVPRKMKRRAAFSARNATQGSEARLHQTEPPNAHFHALNILSAFVNRNALKAGLVDVVVIGTGH
jgi:hypothetical protein